VATYRSGFSVDAERQTFDVLTRHSLPEKDTWPNNVVVVIDRRPTKEQAA
jgi:hypothetical protein